MTEGLWARLGASAVGALPDLAAVLLVRSAPWMCCLAFGRQPKTARISAILAAVVLVSAIAVSPQNRATMLNLVLGYAYYAACALAVHWIAAQGAAVGALDSALLFLSLLIVLFVAPAFFNPVAASAFLFIGWELALKSYSLILEARKHRLPLKDAMFFLLVDPSIVVVDRATRQHGPAAKGHVRRCALGALSMFAGIVLGSTLLVSLGAHVASNYVVASSVALFPILGLATLVTEYAKHSGAASVQLSLMRLAGFRVQERYNRPLLARTPQDFWNRWNTYVGGWAKRYLFLPAARSMKVFGDNLRANGALAMLITFAAIGFFHDTYMFALTGSFGAFKVTIFFVLNGVLVVTQVLTGPKVAPPIDASKSISWTNPMALKRYGWTFAFLFIIGFVATNFSDSS